MRRNTPDGGAASRQPRNGIRQNSLPKLSWPFALALTLFLNATACPHVTGQYSLPQPLAEPSDLMVQHHGTSTMLPNVPVPIPHGPYDGYLDSYRSRAFELPNDAPNQIDWGQIIGSQQSDDVSGLSTIDAVIESLPLQMWWDERMQNQIGLSDQTYPVDVGTLAQIALLSSPRVQSLLATPHIRQSDVVVADAEFDPTLFLEGKYSDANDPVGSTLTTGDGSTRFRDETLTSALGVRSKNRAGGELDLSQRGGFQENNSLFLTPNPQGTTRLELNYTHPLMRDGGQAVNRTRIVLAQLDWKVSRTETRQELENHLLAVTEAYWNLYEARVHWLQQQKLIASASRLYEILWARRDVDSHQRQILRAQSALTSRKSELARAATRIKNAQAQIRMLTGSAELLNVSSWEWTPIDRPLAIPVAANVRQSVIEALENRADVTQAIRKIQAVSTKVGAAKNQVLPRLDLILGAYVAGLDSDRNTFGAFGNQFSEGRPGYSMGMLYELPAGRRASLARLNRTRWEMTQAIADFQQTTETVFTEVEIAVRETETLYNEMVAKKLAIDAAESEVSFLTQRWEQLPNPNESAIVLIESLLTAQERLADEESAMIEAQIDYAMAWVRLRKVSGILLRVDTMMPETGQAEIVAQDTSCSETGGQP
ncbi:TolC family protein [Stieleria varia]|uniref:TolC family protein n=1 Tax=Stieleria varia TaxID=2528005 RepID=UPI001E4E332D|nr:TolC family protein [Stieleria varia]